MIKRKNGFWILIGIGVLLNLEYLFGQTMAVINYDFTVSAGLQEPVNEITPVGVAMNKGFGVGDTSIYIPIFIAGIIGLFKQKLWGVYLMFGAMAITAYWPVVCLTTLFFAKNTPGWGFCDYTTYTIFLSGITTYGIWGMFYLFRNRKVLAESK